MKTERLLTMAMMAVLLVAQGAMAQSAADTNCVQGEYQPHWGIVQCVAGSLGDTRLSTAFAVGTFDTDQRIFLTPRHAVVGARQIRLMGERVDAEATVLAEDEVHDVAVLVATVPPSSGLSNLRLASQVTQPDQTQPPQQQNRYPWDGFSPGDSQLRRATPATYTLNDAYLWSRVSLLSGMSGGLVHSGRGGVQGMIVARNSEQKWGLAINSIWLRDFLARKLTPSQLAGVAGEPITLSSDWERRDKATVRPRDWQPVSYKVHTPLLFGSHAD